VTRSGESRLLDDGDDALDVLVGKWCFLNENTVASMAAPREERPDVRGHVMSASRATGSARPPDTRRAADHR
jgi:hypothetical protein